ncbi:hypothetical protein [Rhizobium lusitanum]|nr:hypothetical protein [Rhizobium lusitanum]
MVDRAVCGMWARGKPIHDDAKFMAIIELWISDEIERMYARYSA